MEEIHQQLLQRIHQHNEAHSMQQDTIIERLDLLKELALNGQIKGIGLFWTVDDGYNCFITNNHGNVFGLHGYISAATDRYIQEYLNDKEDYIEEDEDDNEEEQEQL